MPTTELIQAYANLGRVWRSAGSRSVSFADPVAIADAEVLGEIQEQLEEEIGRIDRVFDVTLDDSDTFRGKVEQRISGLKSQVLKFALSPSGMSYVMLNADEVESFAEGNWSKIVEFAATTAAKGKGSRAGKKLNCKPGNMQCGGKCQSGKLNCTKNASPEQKKKTQETVKKAKAKTGKPAQTATPEKPAETTPKEETPKTSALAVRNSSIQRSGSDSENSTNREQDLDSLPPLERINAKYASSDPSDEAIDSWQREMLQQQTTAEALAVRELSRNKFEADPGSPFWETQPEYIKNVSDRSSFINAVVRRQQERAKAREGEREYSWEDFSLIGPKERERLQRQIDNPKTTEANREKARRKLEGDRESSEAAAERLNARNRQTPEDLRKALEEEFDASVLKNEGRARELREKIDRGLSSVVNAETERILRTYSSDVYAEAYRGRRESAETTRERQRSIIRDHLINQAGNERPEKVLGLSTNSTPAQVKAAYRQASRAAHPDAGGSAEEFHRVNEAYKALRLKLDFSEIDYSEEDIEPDWWADDDDS